MGKCKPDECKPVEPIAHPHAPPCTPLRCLPCPSLPLVPITILCAVRRALALSPRGRRGWGCLLPGHPRCCTRPCLGTLDAACRVPQTLHGRTPVQPPTLFCPGRAGSLVYASPCCMASAWHPRWGSDSGHAGTEFRGAGHMPVSPLPQVLCLFSYPLQPLCPLPLCPLPMCPLPLCPLPLCLLPCAPLTPVPLLTLSLGPFPGGWHTVCRVSFTGSAPRRRSCRAHHSTHFPVAPCA